MVSFADEVPSSRSSFIDPFSTKTEIARVQLNQPNEASDFEVPPDLFISDFTGPEEMQGVSKAEELGMGRITFFGLNLNSLN